jgi:uncharacterized protein YqjF (DUF2071 family)
MRQRWDTLTFLHWGYPIEDVQRILPKGLTVEARDGLAWVGLVPFSMRVGAPLGRGIPRIARFPETNVRTYVIGPDGRTGVWFFSLDAGNSLAVSAARLTLGLPYFLAAMEVEPDGDTIRYNSSRREGPASGSGHRIAVNPGAPIDSRDLSEFDHYLTARFALWNTRGRLAVRIPIEHPPWRLYRGEVVSIDQDLLEAAGLPSPSGDPIVHYSEGVDVSVGSPRVVR